MNEDSGTMFGLLVMVCGFITGNALENLAVGKPATQTDTSWGGLPGKAVDGSTVTAHFATTACTHTASSTNAWWKVDLGEIYRIDHVKVYGRTDGDTHRLRQVQLFIGKSEEDYVLSGYHEEIMPVPYTFQLTSPVDGRWVKITRASTVNGGSDYLTVCEVEVMGGEVPEGTKFEFVDGQIGTGNLLQTSQARTKTECCVQCKMVDDCSAVNYNSATKVCEKQETVSTIADTSQDIYFYRLP